MVAITRLKPSESIHVDSAIIAALFRAHGAVQAEEVLIEQVEHLTDRISVLDSDITGGELVPTLVQASAEMQVLATHAAQMGLTSLRQTLLAVSQAAEAGNTAALPALWDRVKRIGDQSLVMLWDIPQLRM